MKKAILYVFSGTGNTLIAAEKIRDALLTHGVEADVWRITAPYAAAPDVREYDVAGFGYPIHAFNAPQFFLRFLRSLPKVEGMPCFLFKTSGEPFAPNHASSFNAVSILRRKGFVPGLDPHLLMPYNIMFRYPNALAKQMYAHTGRMAGSIASRVAAGDWDRLSYNPVTIGWAYLLRLQWLGAWINGPLIHVKKDRCTGCGCCARSCPAGNIVMRDGKPHFGAHCTMCMGCTFHCPSDAVRPGFLNPWRVNGGYPYAELMADDSVPDAFVNDQTRGYFRLFRKYYRQTEEK